MGKKKKNNKFRHNKKRNTAFLFEVLVKELTKASLRKDEDRKGQVVKVLKKHFAKGTTLHRELDLYRSLSETKNIDRDAAERLLKEAKAAYRSIPGKVIFDAQSELIADIASDVGIGVYSNFVPNYKNLATLSQIFNDTSSLSDRVMLEHALVESISETKSPEEEFQHITNLAYRTFTKKFNKEYSGKLHEEQQELINKYIFSFADNGVGLKVYLNEEIGRLKNEVERSFEMKEIREDKNMLANAKSVLSILDGFSETPISEQQIKKVLKIQDLVREVGE